MTFGIVCSRLDEASSNMAECLIKNYSFEALSASGEIEVYENDLAKLFLTDSELTRAEFIDSLGLDAAFILSKHASKANVASLTTHSLGNWNNTAQFGGKPKELSFAAPIAMLESLKQLGKIEFDAQKTYEATHHGPLLKTPSLFFEISGSELIIKSMEIAIKAANAAYGAMVNCMNSEVEYNKVVIGIGSTHYPANFSSLALAKGYAFSHIMPKYAMENEDGSYNFDMLGQALERTTNAPDSAVIDWKSLNAAARDAAIKELEKIGLDYERI